ncbi:MAG: DUF362 domain-containing protein [Phycisphaerae bacterium]|nr:DUF362 domain-containing protein [Phycisphaerae bacterium]NIV14058.1 DUF362 domain-containing protein [Fodinibius sp.]NIW92612.1 DUF362 domain-containing protein [Phycisphaerae bacterium]
MKKRNKEVTVMLNMNTLRIPDQMRLSKKAWPIVYVQPKDLDLWHASSGVASLVGDTLGTAIKRVHNKSINGQVLLKVHIGEPNCITRMRPEFVVGSWHQRFLREMGASGIVVGDTTVAYSGPRGHKKNPVGHASKYLRLAWKHGWSRKGKAGVPFVVLDRPVTAKSDEFEFIKEDICFKIEGIKNFKTFYVAGGFAAADFVVNHAHLTLHGLAGMAGCVKSIAMGCSGLNGKLQMHQSLLPHFDAKLCVGCGQCVESCPEDALQLNEGNTCPTVNPESCIGCGECEAVCTVGQGAIKLRGEEITNWDRGGQTLPVRMADYIIGLMNGRWDNVVHILHMYAVTNRCDCVNSKQKPFLEKDLGFLIGKNPFAVDRLATKLLAEALQKQGHNNDETFLKSTKNSSGYVHATYGIITEVPIEKISIS